MGKKIKFANETYLDSSGIMHDRSGKHATRSLDAFLPKGSTQSSLYTTQYMQLGYFECSMVQYEGWSNLTLLVSSAFYGNQHWSTHLLTIAQAEDISANYVRVGGTSRQFFYKADTANKRVYLYVRVTGGNGFGNWSTTILNEWQCYWHLEVIQNIEYDSSWIQITSDIPDQAYSTSNVGDYIVLRKNANEEPLNWTQSGTWLLHALHTVDRVSGESFTKTSDNATVQVGKNVKRVRVDASCQFTIATSKVMYVMLAIFKNNTQVAMAIRTNTFWDTLFCTTCLDVVEGDLISCKVYKGEGDTVQIYDLLASFLPGRGNYLIVECIG